MSPKGNEDDNASDTSEVGGESSSLLSDIMMFGASLLAASIVAALILVFLAVVINFAPMAIPGIMLSVSPKLIFTIIGSSLAGVVFTKAVKLGRRFVKSRSNKADKVPSDVVPLKSDGKEKSSVRTVGDVLKQGGVTDSNEVKSSKQSDAFKRRNSRQSRSNSSSSEGSSEKGLVGSKRNSGGAKQGATVKAEKRGESRSKKNSGQGSVSNKQLSDKNLAMEGVKELIGFKNSIYTGRDGEEGVNRVPNAVKPRESNKGRIRT